MPRLYPALVLAQRFRLRALRGCWGALGDGVRRVSMQGLRRQHIADGRYRVPGHPQAVAHVVSCDVVYNQPEEWHERSGSVARTWLG